MNAASEQFDQRIVKAIKHPLRLEILRTLEEGIASPVEIARRLEEPLNVVSYHVRVLADLGLIRIVRRTPRRGAIEHHYEVREQVVDPGDGWVSLPRAATKARVSSTLQRIADTTQRAGEQGALDAQDAVVTLTPARLDERGRRELAQALAKLAARVQRLEEQSAKRLASAEARRDDDEAHGRRPTTVVLMAFDTPPRAQAARAAKPAKKAKRRAGT